MALREEEDYSDYLKDAIALVVKSAKNAKAPSLQVPTFHLDDAFRLSVAEGVRAAGYAVEILDNAIIIETGHAPSLALDPLVAIEPPR